jgi:hypothetical protein
LERSIVAKWRETLAQVGFQPYGSLGAMRAVIEDVEAIAIENGLGRLSFTITHLGRRSAMQYEVVKSLDPTAQEVAQLLVDAFERAHPEARDNN